MVFLWILFAALGYLAYRTKPTREGLERLLQTRGGGAVVGGTNGGRPGRWLSSLVANLLGGGARSTPTLIYNDLLVAWLVRVEETQQLFLGIFGRWFPLSVPSNWTGILDGEGAMGMVEGRMRAGSAGTGRSSGSAAEQTLEAGRIQANTLKASGKYAQAAEAYLRCAQLAAVCDVYSMAELYEEAAKCKKMLGDLDGMEEASVKAAKAFQKQGRLTRAATICERCAQTLRASKRNSHGDCISKDSEQVLLERARQLFAQSVSWYELEDDRRADGCRLEIAEIDALLGRWMQAAEVFEREAAATYQRDAILVNQSCRLLLFSLLCQTRVMEEEGRGGEGLLIKKIDQLAQLHSWFPPSRESRWVRKLGEALQEAISMGSFDPDTHLDMLDRELYMMAALPPWALNLWEEMRKKLQNAQPDLT